MAKNNKFAIRLGILIFGTAICAIIYAMTQRDRTAETGIKETTETVTPVAEQPSTATQNVVAEEGENVKAYAEHLSNYNYKEGMPAIIDFFATWCGPCKRMAPGLHKVAEEYQGKMNVITVDVDQDRIFAEAAGIEAMPTLFFISKDGTIQRHVGALDYDTLKQIATELTK